MHPHFQKIPSGGGAVVVLEEGVWLFGSDEERGEGIVFLLYVGPT